MALALAGRPPSVSDDILEAYSLNAGRIPRIGRISYPEFTS